MSSSLPSSLSSSSSTNIDSSNGGGTPVCISIYDMYTMNNYTSVIGVGVYHTGVEIYGVEYSYGGHPYHFSGIFEMPPRDCEELGETFNFKESIEIGRTDFTPDEVEQIIALLGREFRGIDYHLINNNCNHFTDKLCKTLCGTEIPAWINRLAYITTFVPFIERIIPKEWISPLAVQNSIEHQLHENNNLNTPSNTTNNNNNSSNNIVNSSRPTSPTTTTTSLNSNKNSTTTTNTPTSSNGTTTSSSATTVASALKIFERFIPK